MKKIIYLRTSTEEQNPDNQLRDCKTLVSGEFELLEEKQSAWKDKDRLIFESIRTNIKSRKVSELIVWDLDRLFRNRKKLIEFFSFCKVYQCKINSFRQQWLNKFNDIPEPFNEILFDMMIQIMGWQAEEESQKKSDRVKIAHKNHHGKKWGRPSIHTNKKKIVWDLREQGKSIRAISKLTKLSVGKVSQLCSEKQTTTPPTNTPTNQTFNKGSINEL